MLQSTKKTSPQNNFNPTKERIYSVQVDVKKANDNLLLTPFFYERGCNEKGVTIVADGNGNQKQPIPSTIQPTAENGYLRAKVPVKTGDIVINALITDEDEIKIFISRITEIKIDSLNHKAEVKTKLLTKYNKNIETNQYSWFCSKRTIDSKFTDAIIATVAALRTHQLETPIFVVKDNGIIATPLSEGIITRETEDSIYNTYVKPFLSQE
jgi:hypothetical protein